MINKLLKIKQETKDVYKLTYLVLESFKRRRENFKNRVAKEAKRSQMSVFFKKGSKYYDYEGSSISISEDTKLLEILGKIKLIKRTRCIE